MLNAKRDQTKCKFQIKVSVQTTKLQSHKTVKQKSIRQKKKRKTWIFSIKYFKVPEAANVEHEHEQKANNAWRQTRGNKLIR